MVKISRRSDGGKSTKISFKNVRYGSQKTVSNHLKDLILRPRVMATYGFLAITFISDIFFFKLLKHKEED